MKKSFAVLLSFLLTASSLSAMEFVRDEEYSKTQNIPNKPTLKEQLSVERLVTNKEHINFLKHALETAEQDIMISSYRISAKKLMEEGIDKSIKSAAERGVDIYVYYNKSSQKEYNELCKIAQHCFKFEEIDNHSKCIIKDRRIHGKRTVAIGSYNWLAESIEGSSNASMVLTGMFVQGLGADIWDGIKFYRSLREENEKGVKKFLGSLSAFTTGEYKFEEGEYYYTLSTPEAYQTLFNEVVEKANERVLLFSPFIRLEKLQSTFTSSFLETLQKRKINIKLITLFNPCYSLQEQKEIFSYLDKLSNNSLSFSYLKHDNFHAKTLLADDDFICEGSRNCLSSVDDLSHDKNNFELSVAVRGKNAKKLIEAFEKTDIGQLILIKKQIQIQPQKDIEKKRKIVSPSQNDNKKLKSENSKPSLDTNNVSSSSKQENFKIYYNKKGFYVRLNPKECLVDDKNEIAFFSNYVEAQRAASELASPSFPQSIKLIKKSIEKKSQLPFNKTNNSKKTKPVPGKNKSNNSQSQNNFKFSSSKKNVKSSSQQNNFEIFSGRNFGKKGFCVRFDKRDYLVDDKEEIVYFSTYKEAQQAAFEFK
jgi:phosphatidylserine/phosphatidylglycerophosphate/cardiolipin synthase-like enzyme